MDTKRAQLDLKNINNYLSSDAITDELNMHIFKNQTLTNPEKYALTNFYLPLLK